MSELRGRRGTLFSLSTLDTKGYKYTNEGGVLKVSQGSLIMMKGLKSTTNLYVLNGIIIVVIAVIAFISMSDDDVSKLCHMRCWLTGTSNWGFDNNKPR